MRVGDAEIFENALDRAVLAERSVQGVEGDVRLELGKHGADVAADVDARDPVALGLQRIGARLAGGQRHRPLRRETAHEDSDMLLHSPVIPSRRFCTL